MIDLQSDFRETGVSMSEKQINNPLHGKTLKMILTELVERYGWESLGAQISINCFSKNPNLNGSLRFLRKTPWARTKVENLYLKSIGEKPRSSVRKKPPGARKMIAEKPIPPSKPRINKWTGEPMEE